MPGVPGRSGGHNAKLRKDHELRGTYRRDRHAHVSNPAPPMEAPAQPVPLEGPALEEWGRMVERLRLSGTLARVDDGVLYQHCRVYAETEALAESRDEVAASVKILEENLAGLQGEDLVACFQEIGKLRKLQAHYSNQIRQGRMAMRVFFVEFGLSPASRSRVKVAAKPDDANPWDGLLN